MRRILAGSLVLGLATVAGVAAAGDVAIIVSSDHPQEALTLNDLGRIFRMEQQHWRAGGRIEVVLQISGSVKDTIVMKRLLRVEPSEAQAFWLGKLFRGEIPAPPRTLASDGGVKQYIAGNSHAIGYVDALLLDASVTALKIDGKAPGEPGYPLARH